ncbi:MAG: universal stress protein [Bacteroidota bacterium]
MIKKILVPIDFSECSKNALRSVIPMARRMNAELLLLNVFSVLSAVSETGAEMYHELADEKEREIKDDFQQLIEDFPELSDVEFSYVLRQNYVPDAISQVISDKEIDLVVMGTKGASGVEEVLMGSNAYHVIKNTQVPIIALPDGSQLNHIKSIALASDYKKMEDPRVLEPITAMAHLFGAEIHILHFSDGEHISGEEAWEARKLEKYLKRFQHSFHFIVEKDVEEGINNYLEKHGIGMLAIIPRKHNLLDKLFKKSWTRKLTCHTKIPLMAIHE